MLLNLLIIKNFKLGGNRTIPRKITFFKNSNLPLYGDPFSKEQLMELSYDEHNREQWKFKIDWAIDRFMARYDFRTLLDSKEIYVKDFQKNYYHEHGEILIHSELSRFEDHHQTIILAKHRTKLIKEIKYRTLFDRENFAEHKYPEWINLQNCCLNVLTKETLEHNQVAEDFKTEEEWIRYDQLQNDLKFLTYMDLKYDEHVQCSNFQIFLQEILPKEEDQKTIYQWFGYCLLNDYPIQKAVLFIGPGANGKSTVLNVLRKFLGNQNVTGVEIYDLMKNRFAAAELYKRKANIQPDLSHKLIKDASMFKKLTGQDLLKAERKNQQPFDFINTAKILISCNQAFMLDEEEETYAFFRRWNLINFPIRIEEKNQIPLNELLKKIANECELSGILNKSLLALQELLETKKFANQILVNEIWKKWIKLSNSSKWFWSELVSMGDEDDPGKDIEKYTLKKVLTKISEIENIPDCSMSLFNKTAKELGFKKKYKTVSGVRDEYYLNLHFNNGYSHVLQTILTEQTSKGSQKSSSQILDKFLPDLLGLFKSYLLKLSYVDDEGEIYASDIFDLIGKEKGFTREFIDSALLNFLTEGELYEPRSEVFKLSTD